MRQRASIPADGPTLKRDITAYAQSLGFSRVGVTTALPFEKEGVHLETWLAGGHHGEMDYLSADPAKRSDPKKILPNARSVIALAMNYYNEGQAQPRVARYAWGKDYHKLIRKRLESLTRYMEALAPGVECRSMVDTGPFLERAAAQRAGLGFVGKNTMVITKGLGSWVFLASVVTSLELPTDAPDVRTCGTCRLCLDACPTQAFKAPYELDARKCIAYLTIESDKPVDPALADKTQDWLFGCDVCQEVCPHNTRVPPTPVPDLVARPPLISLEQLLAMQTDEEFAAQFSGTPFMRAGRAGMQRNAKGVEAYFSMQKRPGGPLRESHR